MSLYSLIGSKLHRELQRLVHLHPPAPMLAAFVLLTSVPVLCASPPPAFVGRLPLSLWRRLARLNTTPGRVATLFQALMHTLTTACLHIRITVRLPDRWGGGHGRCQESDTYRTAHEEARYWRLAERYRRRLYSGGTQVQAKIELGLRNTRSRVSAQLVEYYTPRLLPVYRETRSENSQEADTTFTISPKTYCKWHRMVFPDCPHPTLTQAARRIKRHSPRDLREILRISRLAPIGKAFRTDGDEGSCTTKYQELWQAYLEQTSMDLVIVFE